MLRAVGDGVDASVAEASPHMLHVYLEAERLKLSQGLLKAVVPLTKFRLQDYTPRGSIGNRRLNVRGWRLPPSCPAVDLFKSGMMSFWKWNAHARSTTNTLNNGT